MYKLNSIASIRMTCLHALANDPRRLIGLIV